MAEVTLYNADCLEVIKTLPDESIDLILCDLPYQETGNKWDKMLDLNELFKEYERVIKEDGAIVLTGTFKFGVILYNIAPHLYKYDWVWEKDNGTNAPNVNLQPFRIHENVYVFGKGRVTNGKRTAMKYNPQKTEGKPYCQKSGRMSENWKGGLGTVVTDNKDGLRHPKTIQKFIRDKGGLHPTQKPVELYGFLLNTFAKQGDRILDTHLGSGSSRIAAHRLGFDFVGIEIDKEYFDASVERFERECKQQPTIFDL